MEWLDAHHPDYLDRLASLVSAGRIEIIGGAVLRADPGDASRRATASARCRPTPPGCRTASAPTSAACGSPSASGNKTWPATWPPPASITSILDDSHFKNAGLTEDELHGYYLTEDDGRWSRVIPGSERLRYVIPFGAPQDTIDYLRNVAERHPNAIAMFADDGEKFGVWPETQKSVFDEGWLGRLFDLLAAKPELDSHDHARRRRSTTCRRWAPSIFPKAATAK